MPGGTACVLDWSLFETANEQNDVIPVGEIVVSALLFYFLILAMVRLVGKRSTSQFNSFDWIINITVGSLAASGILLRNVPFHNAAAAIVMIMLGQFALTKLVLRFDWASRLVKARPTLLTHRGRYLEQGMKKTRISPEEIKARLRAEGLTDVEEADWVILETDGTLTVLPAQDTGFDDVEVLDGVEVLDDIERRDTADSTTGNTPS